MSIGKIISYRYIKAIADKIVTLLDKVYDSPLSNKRWVWELMQNAKDCPNRFGRVSVEIHLYHDKLVFKHNGDCFSDSDLASLVLQVSSKDSANEGELNQTGKFGTGFITTHLLSKVIDVEGIVWNSDAERHQRFNIRLDRSARKSEDMIQSINETIDALTGLDNDDFERFPIFEGYENRGEDSFDTSFTYPLENDDALRSAQVGLEDLVNTLPITMVSLPKIKSVKVNNHITGESQKYYCESERLLKEEGREIIKSCVNINGERKYFLTYTTFKDESPYVALSIETEISEDGKYKLVARDKDQPVLFRDFPLIGSEKFYFPYMLNGFDFDPTETRSGILLNNDEPKPKKNRAIVENAIQAVLAFNEWLISKGAGNTYLMASSRQPEPETTWDETYALPWIKEQMKSWHEKLLDQNLIETADGYVKLSQIKLPDYGGIDANRKFYEFLSDFKIFCLPLRGQQDEWAKVLSWAKDNKFSKEDFFKRLEGAGNVSALANHLGKTESDTYDWLNRLYRFIVEQNDIAQLDNYQIIPNQMGTFCLLKDLRTDSAQRIPEKIKNIANALLQKDLRKELMSENVDDTVFTNRREYKLDNLIHDINQIIKDLIDNKIPIAYEKWGLVSKCVYDIIALHTNNDGEAQKRENMRRFVSHFVDGMTEEGHIDNLPSSLWEEADKFVISYVPHLIEAKAKTISELGSELLCYPSKHDEEECINWLNVYNDIVSSYNMGVSGLSIFPNQKGDLMRLSELHYDKGIPSELIDLNVTANNGDWRQKLLDRRIIGHETQDPLGTADIYKGISDKFTSSHTAELTKFDIAREAITLCPKTIDDSSDNIRVVHGFLKKSDTGLPDCREIENSTGFYWEIFVANILKEVCDRISRTVNITGLAQLICENEEDTISYVDSVLDFAKSRYGGRYEKYVTEDYGLWINQYGDFCKLNDISKDDNIDEDVKDIAMNPIIGIDYKEKLLRKNMGCERFLPQGKTTKDILVEIDDKISEYVEVDRHYLQDGNFTKLVAELMIATKKHPDYSSSLKYFDSHKDKLFVGSIGDEETLSLFSSIASTPERKELFTELNKYSNAELQKIVDGDHITAMGDITKFYSGVSTEDLPTARFVEDDGLSLEERKAANEEARRVVFQMLSSDGFDVSNAKGDSSVVNGVTKDGVEYPLVIKSYSRKYNKPFHVNPLEWIQLNKNPNSMLLIYTDGQIGKVTFSDLFRNQDKMVLQFSLEALGDKRNVFDFAKVLKFLKGCTFDFSNLLTTRYESMRDYRLGQNNPNAFLDLSSDDPNLID